MSTASGTISRIPLSSDAENLTLEGVGTIPGKRESRRFEGLYMLRQDDLLEQRQHDDAVAFGGWSIDLHPGGRRVQRAPRLQPTARPRHLPDPVPVPGRLPSLPGAPRRMKSSGSSWVRTRTNCLLPTHGRSSCSASTQDPGGHDLHRRHRDQHDHHQAQPGDSAG
ncbi:MAG: FAD-dependent oxidoreductase [Propionibacteriaceae bacterium]